MSEEKQETIENTALQDAQQQEKLAQEELDELKNFISELQTKIASKTKLRTENYDCDRPAESHFAKLDSSLKKNTAFVKKLRQFTAAQLDQLLKDMTSLNLSKYITEICSAVCDAKIKMTDVPAAVILCSKLNQIYSDFSASFLEAWQKTLALKTGEKIANPSKLRVDLRLFAELVSSGVINSKQGLSLLGAVLVNVISSDKEDHSNFSIILSFCRHCGEEYAGLVPRKMLLIAEKHNMTDIPKSDFLTSEKQQNLRSLLKDYFKNLCKHLLSEQEELLNMTKNIRRTVESKGELSNDKREKCEIMQSNFDKLHTSVQTLSDLINEPLPELAKETEMCSPGTVIDSILEDTSMGELDPWGDEETKQFYTDLPDLRQYLPNFSAPKVDNEQIEEPTEMTEEAIDANIDADIDIDDPPSASSDLAADKEAEGDEKPEEATTQILPEKIGNALMEVGRSCSGYVYNSKHQFDQFLINLNNCVNKELIDSAAIEFLLNFNTKNNRKKLTKSINTVQRTRLDLLPFLSRFVAIVNLCNTDVAIELSELLRKEFKWHIRKKNQLNIESKIKIVRFIGEMVKFGLCKKFDALGCLKMLLRDFQHHQIEMACAFVEVAGVYLYNCRDSRLLTNVFLDQMMRLKTATALDSRYAAQIDNVYYLVKRPKDLNEVKVQRPVIHSYIRNIVFEELCKQNVDRCIKMMRRINWDDPTVKSYAIKCLSKAYLLRFPLIRSLADLVSGLTSYQENIVANIIDNVCDDIRFGLEKHSPRLAQRRIAMVKYLGELYNYKLIDSITIINMLYSIISLGVVYEDGVVSELDPPDSLFRLKLVITLLDTSGQYFTSTLSHKKMDYFLVFFQRYYWHKKSHPIFSKNENTFDLFPILVDHMYKECFTFLRPKMKLYKNLEEAVTAVEDLKLKLYPNLGKTASESNDKGLESISEDNEYDDGASENSNSLDSRRNSVQEGDEMMNADMGNTGDFGNNTDWTENEYVLEDYEEKMPEKSKEDLEFEQMFEKMAADSYQERLKETVKPNTKDIPVPMVTRKSKKSYEQITSQQGNNDDTSKNSSEGTQFVLMMRGGKGKQQFKQFIAPNDSHLAINLKKQEEKIREEHEKVKRLTLNISERIEEEDYQESLLQSQRNMAQNSYQRPNKQKFKHQRGAPDADLIFN
ncbi:regulator of nonsense transcripts 2-like isoform X1 [Teleopsis dalmanni]|uniref:regulator of nonsense transcripts 2-like isoform X1 n=1 Tax=Teleopsis dalmanni TaxID=139649 RepID=UPI0018CF6316|nr:regulator of nonsense transcripts 2-like isoform X1 [Teleopsis dalmanni]